MGGATNTMTPLNKQSKKKQNSLAVMRPPLVEPLSLNPKIKTTFYKN